MDDLIKALTIFKKYTDSEYPTCCEHDILHVIVNPDIVSLKDIEELETLGFIADEDSFRSYRFGSC